MKLRTTIITAGALVALIVPAAASATASHETTLKSVKTTAVKKSTHVVKVTKAAHATTSTPAPPRVIYIDVPPQNITPIVDPNSCQDNGNDCTDLGACAYWGMNCGSLSPDDAAALQSGDLTPANTTVNDDSTSDTSTSDTSTSDTSTTAPSDSTTVTQNSVVQSPSAFGYPAQGSSDDCS